MAHRRREDELLCREERGSLLWDRRGRQTMICPLRARLTEGLSYPSSVIRLAVLKYCSGSSMEERLTRKEGCRRPVRCLLQWPRQGDGKRDEDGNTGAKRGRTSEIFRRSERDGLNAMKGQAGRKRISRTIPGCRDYAAEWTTGPSVEMSNTGVEGRRSRGPLWTCAWRAFKIFTGWRVPCWIHSSGAQKGDLGGKM